MVVFLGNVQDTTRDDFMTTHHGELEEEVGEDQEEEEEPGEEEGSPPDAEAMARQAEQEVKSGQTWPAAPTCCTWPRGCRRG